MSAAELPTIGTASLGSIGEERFEGTRWGYPGTIKAKSPAGISQRIKYIKAALRKHRNALKKNELHVNILHNERTGHVSIRIHGPSEYFREEASKLEVTWHTGKHFSEAPAWKNHINKTQPKSGQSG